MTEVRGFRDRFRAYTPKWLQNSASGNVGYRVLWTTIVGLDVAMQAIVEGQKAAWPGLGTPTALPLIGSSRGILRGLGESAASYGVRLRAWLDTWKDAAGDAVLLQELQAYLGGGTPLKMRVVSRSGHWTTRASDGTTTFTDAAWDWDSHSNPERNDLSAPFWSDLWIIIYTPPWVITGADLTALVGLWGSYSGLGTGHAVPRVPLDGILSLVALWKGAHTRVRAIIWSYDATLFDPASSGTLPDGWWGKWGKPDPAHPTHTIRARSVNARYWIPTDTNPAD